jgi:hypothetical protein
LIVLRKSARCSSASRLKLQSPKKNSKRRRKHWRRQQQKANRCNTETIYSQYGKAAVCRFIAPRSYCSRSVQKRASSFTHHESILH